MSQDDSPPRPRLDQAKDRLKDALDDACRADVDDADTGEFIRVEEVLAIANDAAKEVISEKRRLRTAPGGEIGDRGRPPMSREVKDAQGVRWTVFAVRPSAGHGAPLREPFQSGWLAFDTGHETRRLAPIPDAWEQMSDRELLALCSKAVVARRRRPSGGESTPRA
jgi:hypothetical protein